MFKKVVASILIITLSVLCLPVFSSASVAVYSDLPEPVPTDNIKYFVIGIDSSYSLYMVNAVVPIEVTIAIDDNRVMIAAAVSENFVIPSITAYRLNNNTLSVSTFSMTKVADQFYQYKFYNFPVTEHNVTVSSYGCMFSDGFNLQPCNVVWNDNTNPATYTTWLQSILNKLNEVDSNTDGLEDVLGNIDSNTDDIELRLKNIYDELRLFFAAFTIYQNLQQ